MPCSLCMWRGSASSSMRWPQDEALAAPGVAQIDRAADQRFTHDFPVGFLPRLPVELRFVTKQKACRRLPTPSLS